MAKCNWLVILVFVNVFFYLAPAYADTIILVNGKSFEGIITAEEDDRVQIEVTASRELKWFPRNQIDSIILEYRDVAPAEYDDPEDQAAAPLSVVGMNDPGAAAAPFKGPRDAPVTVMAFTDYQCPACVRLMPRLQQVLDMHPNQVKIVLRNCPWSYHKYAKEAALAALAAHQQGRFWQFHDALTARGTAIDSATIAAVARETYLDLEKFNEDMNGAYCKEQLARDQQAVKDMGVKATPSVFVNGTFLDDRSLRGFQVMIEAELQKKK
ncbi:MAG: hypothetical protein C4520_13575 [Candidatus Abyssobacteria bacterium SURF_5]|uniref:Thioredoxin domain-containing protein n=1 Tax=Abyssobacteria bacterium (strain SURF_5) TaxID=2093360 RepID=A0A3A4NLJ1_ABYX5|nr:MAG: hypothetical protein C4520_13575 [Candidatus Abyssubacteria bacterium SURF_5]